VGVRENVAQPKAPKGYRQTEVGLIPEDWSLTRIDYHASIKTGSKNTQDRVDDGLYPFFVRSQQVERINSYSYEGEAVLTAGDGVGTGKVFHYINGRFDVHQRVYRITEFSDHLDGLYFFYQFSTRFYDRIMSMTAKSSVRSVRMEMIAGMLIPLPPIHEQRAIAGALSDVDGLVGALEALIAKKRAIRQATMQQLLTAKTRLPGFTSKWEKKRLGEIVSFQVGFPFSSRYFTSEPSGLRIVKNRDLKADDEVTHHTGPYSGSYLVSDGDVLIGMDGDFLPCVWRKGKALLNQRVGRLLRRDSADLRFMYYFLIEPLKEIERATSSTTVKHLSHGDVEGIVGLIPEEDEQTAIAAVLSDMDAEIAALERRRDKTKQIKQGIMQQLLTGRIRLVEPNKARESGSGEAPK